MTRVLLICNDIVGENMAGPGIRYWEMARVLGSHFDVTLAVPPFIADQTPSTDRDWLRICRTSQELHSLVATCDVIVTLGVVLLLYPFVAKAKKPLVVDLYDPFLLEDLQRKVHMDWLDRLTSYESYLKALQIQLLAGDFFICAAEKQRDYWLGMLSAMGRINPYTYQDDPSLRRLIDVVPFGLPEEPPKHTRPVLKGVLPSIQPDDKVILWGGGIWEWLDASTLINAMPYMLARRNDVKLFFMGIKRSNQELSWMAAVDRAIARSKELGLYETHIIFNDWVPYNERQNYLLEADVGVSLHLDHVEARFAFRTRLLDYLWAGLPIVSTSGDVLGEALAAQGLAKLVAPGDVEGVAQAILDVLEDSVRHQGLRDRRRAIAESYRWNVVVKPLEDFCAAPYFAPDKRYLAVMGMAHPRRQRGWQHFLRKSWLALQLGGARSVIAQVRNYARWKMRQS